MALSNRKQKHSVPGDFVMIRGAKVWKPYAEMNTSELRAATAEFDQEFVADSFKPLSPEMRRRWNLIKRGRGRPKVGKGARVISVSVEKELLKKADRLAKKLKISRARLISNGLKSELQKNITS